TDEQRSVDVRYRGQGYELNVPFTEQLVSEFHRMHSRRYGYSHPGREVELVTLRLRLTVRSQGSATKDRERGVARVESTGLSPRPRSKASIVFDGVRHTGEIWERATLRPGEKHRGPAVIAEYSATTLIPPGKRFWVDQSGNLSIEIKA